jgi:hypothetical protein
MQVYLFASERHVSASALTSDGTGGNLPADYAPWRPINGGNAMAISTVSDPIAAAIGRDGYFLLSTKSR